MQDWRKFYSIVGIPLGVKEWDLASSIVVSTAGRTGRRPMAQPAPSRTKLTHMCQVPITPAKRGFRNGLGPISAKGITHNKRPKMITATGEVLSESHL